MAKAHPTRRCRQAESTRSPKGHPAKKVMFLTRLCSPPPGDRAIRRIGAPVIRHLYWYIG